MIKWFGDRIAKRLRRAQVIGIDATMTEAVIYAKSNHAWKNRTAVLEGSIGISEPARQTRNGASGTWGSQDVLYAIFQELGTKHIPARPYLRPAADAMYPNLADHIRRAL